jgi:hypothetical protein
MILQYLFKDKPSLDDVNRAFWTIVIVFALMGTFLILHPLPDIAKAYNCSSSGSSTTVSGNSGGCATSSASTAFKNGGVGGGSFVPAPNFKEGFYLNDAFHFGHGYTASYGAGGGQSSCLASSANQFGSNDRVAGFVNGASQQGSCTASSP